MNTKQVQRFVQRYLEATQCTIMEKSPYHIKVKLSPEADRELTNRPYYWSFIDRLNETPETMSFLFVFDEEKYNQMLNEQSVDPAPALSAEDKALDRVFGFAPKPIMRVPKEHLHFGSNRLQQLFDSTQRNGSFVCLYQEPQQRALHPYASRPYTAWLAVNYVVELSCDRKREELFSLGISLVTGHCVEHFHDRLQAMRLSPRIPANVHLAKNGISYNKALSIAEAYIERKLKSYDYDWAVQAQARLKEELERLDSFYKPLLQHAEAEQEQEILQLQQKRMEEIRWQYEPRITASVINCGLFHLDGID
ncbi:hypothetical protein J40TS1_24140 [Paenibacillus montaniterrae]|uniref:Uncharacterized protein n=1 Tax=Paenibacillus montaniterrae TaxID=429341 RepID=A0A919YLS6_9BACL|nr:YqhG family protein [Paenibacillus montaniterrae]GIP16772.1 hypothetical protein J40TS1_24140 [Paenibacillus montaniterrae]